MPLPDENIEEWLRVIKDDDWLDAELYTVYDYIRCSKRLNDLPSGLKALLPVR